METAQQSGGRGQVDRQWTNVSEWAKQASLLGLLSFALTLGTLLTPTAETSPLPGTQERSLGSGSCRQLGLQSHAYDPTEPLPAPIEHNNINVAL